MCLCLGCAIIAAGFLPNARPAIEVRTDEESEGEVTSWMARFLGPKIAVQRHARVFVVFAFGDMLAVMALYIPYSCINELSPVDEAKYLIAIIGGGSILGRFASALLCNWAQIHPSFKMCLVPTAVLIAAFIPTIYAFSLGSFTTMAMLCFSLGATSGVWIAATSPILVQLLGLPQVRKLEIRLVYSELLLFQLNTAFGRLTALRGTGALLAPPFAAGLVGLADRPLLPLFLSSGLFSGAVVLFALAAFLYKRHEQ